jgi:hypothetical protein
MVMRDEKPHFIDPDDPADSPQPLPIFVTRQRMDSDPLTLKKIIDLLSTQRTKR